MTELSMADVVGVGASYEPDFETDEDGNRIYWKPTNGDKGTVKVTKATAALTAKKAPKFNIWLQFTSGANKGKEFMVRYYYTPANARNNDEVNQVLYAFGLTEEYVRGAKKEEVATSLVDKSAVIVVKFEDSDDPDWPWDRHTFSASKAAAPKRKRKPAPEPEPEPEEAEEEEEWGEWDEED